MLGHHQAQYRRLSYISFLRKYHCYCWNSYNIKGISEEINNAFCVLWIENCVCLNCIQLYLTSTPSTKLVLPESKVHGANMGPTWVLSAPDGPHVGPMNLAIRGDFESPSLTSFKLAGKIWHTSSVDSGALAIQITNAGVLFLCRDRWLTVRYTTMVNTLRPEQNGR